MNTLPPASVPSLAQPAYPGETLLEARIRLSDWLDAELRQQGAVLFRGFQTQDIEQFQQMAASFGHPLLNYEFASTPRQSVKAGVYTSTEYPAHSSIPLHNEQSYTREWPLKIWFFSALCAEQGGETPIADARQVLALMPKSVVERFCRHGLLYVRHYSDELDLPWQQVFNTEDPQQVQRYCQQHAINCQWLADGSLRTRQHCQSIARHPQTGEAVWFNQAHLFHSSALAPEIRATLQELYGEDGLPRQVYYGDGSPIADSDLAQVRQVLDRCKRVFPWQSGDLLMLDNMLCMHGREPFKGARKVVVAMAQAHGNLQDPNWLQAVTG